MIAELREDPIRAVRNEQGEQQEDDAQGAERGPQSSGFSCDMDHVMVFHWLPPRTVVTHRAPMSDTAVMLSAEAYCNLTETGGRGDLASRAHPENALRGRSDAPPFQSQVNADHVPGNS
jgi:hypothetical protein